MRSSLDDAPLDPFEAARITADVLGRAESRADGDWKLTLESIGGLLEEALVGWDGDLHDPHRVLPPALVRIAERAKSSEGTVHYPSPRALMAVLGPWLEGMPLEPEPTSRVRPDGAWLGLGAAAPWLGWLLILLGAAALVAWPEAHVETSGREAGE